MITDTTTSPNTGNSSLLGHLWAAVASTVILTAICCGLYPLLIWALAQGIFPHQANGSLVKKDGSPTKVASEAVGSALIGQAFAQAKYFHPRPSTANNTAGSSYSAGGGYDPTSSGASNYGPLSDELINGLTTAPTPPATQPAEFLAYDGIRLRTIHYALDNSIGFKLRHAVYQKDENKNWQLIAKEEIPLKPFQDASGNLLDTALVDAFPHPKFDDEYARTVVIATDFASPIPADAVTASGSGLDPHISPDNAKLQAVRVAAARNLQPAQVIDLIAQHTDTPNLGVFGDPGVNVLLLNLALDAKYPAVARK